MIELNGHYRMTAETEKAIVELGGADPNKTLTEQELSDALVGAINALADNGKTHILEKIYRAAVASGDLPDISEDQ
jgi:hypothetical protein